MDEMVHYVRLYEWLASYHPEVEEPGRKVTDGLYCAVDEDVPGRRMFFSADRADRERWVAAGRALKAELAAVEEEYRAATDFRHTRARSRAWRIRNARRNARLRREWEPTLARLRERATAAHRAYLEQAGDLTERIRADQERRRRESEERERKARAKRAAARESGRSGAVWDCRFHLMHQEGGILEICHTDLDDIERSADPEDRIRKGLTATEVVALLEEERAARRRTYARWLYHTDQALRETGKTPAEDGWAEVTGVKIRRVLAQGPGDRPPGSRSHGPSSNYWSPSHSCGSSHHGFSCGGFSTH